MLKSLHTEETSAEKKITINGTETDKQKYQHDLISLFEKKTSRSNLRS